jgi:hypothetical protein
VTFVQLTSVAAKKGRLPKPAPLRFREKVNVTLIIWTRLTISLDGKTPANTIMQKMLDQIYAVFPLQ